MQEGDQSQDEVEGDLPRFLAESLLADGRRIV
jgi:hypothetical protein